jgi:hypothetical protein
MVKLPKKEEPEGNPKEGDAILKRMLTSRPKPHKEMKKWAGAVKKGQHPSPDQG